MRKAFIKFAVSAGCAAAVGIGALYGVNAHIRQSKADATTVVVATEARAAPAPGTRWPLPMLTPSI